MQLKADLLTDSLLQFNGNDAVALVRSGVTIDMVGKANAGADVNWGLDVTLQRKSNITHPASVFNQDEWTTLPLDSYALLGAHNMTFASVTNYILQNVFTGINTSYNISNLLPENTYTYSIESMRSGVIAPAINTMQLRTLVLDIPEISDASDVRSTQFTANWGESPFASGYLLNVFKITGQADTTEVEGFANVGSSGTPLPTGWTGTASGNYTSTTSSGAAIPSLALKNKGEWVRTKTYAHPVSRFAFMYRFASASLGSSVLLDALSNGTWLRIDSIPYSSSTSKTYPVYSFTRDKAINAFRITYNKVGSGNLALDDVSATYGSQDTVYVAKNYPVLVNQAVIPNLTENTRYYYAVRATLEAAISGTSETISALTLTNTKVTAQNSTNVRFLSGKDKVVIAGLSGDEFVQVYSLTGVCIYQTKANSAIMNIPVTQSGIFIVRVQGTDYSFTGKLIK